MATASSFLTIAVTCADVSENKKITIDHDVDDLNLVRPSQKFCVMSFFVPFSFLLLGSSLTSNCYKSS